MADEVLLVRMPSELKSRLRVVAREHDRSMSGEVRRALAAHVEREGARGTARVRGERAGEDLLAVAGAAARDEGVPA